MLSIKDNLSKSVGSMKTSPSDFYDERSVAFHFFLRDAPP